MHAWMHGWMHAWMGEQPSAGGATTDAAGTMVWCVREEMYMLARVHDARTVFIVKKKKITEEEEKKMSERERDREEDDKVRGRPASVLCFWLYDLI